MKRSPGCIFIVALSVTLSGCTGNRSGPGGNASESTGADTAQVTDVLDGTIAQVATLAGGGYQVAQGYGLVVGLADKGSSEAPQAVRRALAAEMARHGIGSTSAGLDDLKPDRLIDDKDTAVVIVRAEIPAGAPKGTRVDAFVQALPGTDAAEAPDLVADQWAGRIPELA